MFLCWDRYLPSVNLCKVKPAWIWKSMYGFWSTTEQQKYVKISWVTYSYALLSLGLYRFSTMFSEIFSAQNHRHWRLGLLFREKESKCSQFILQKSYTYSKTVTHPASISSIPKQTSSDLPVFLLKTLFLEGLLYSCFSLHLSCPVLPEFSSQGSLSPAEQNHLTCFGKKPTLYRGIKMVGLSAVMQKRRKENS